MCIILFAYKTHPRYELILAANRDEYYLRPTARAEFWEDAREVLAGRDLERGGTWLGVTNQGRFAAVTNFREPGPVTLDAPSRGKLVSDFLRSSEPATSYLERITSSAQAYNGFNLIVGDRDNVAYLSNRNDGTQIPGPGIYGLSNHLINSPWPKVVRGKLGLSNIISENKVVDTEALFSILADDVRAQDNVLPKTGISLEYERALSSIFISTPIYGTRSSSLLLIDIEGAVTFIERGFTRGEINTDASFQFQIERAVISSRQ